MPYVMRSDDVVLATFEGFSPYKGKTDRIALATFDGEPDLYDVDAGADLADVLVSINRKYNYDYSREPEKLAIYTRTV